MANLHQFSRLTRQWLLNWKPTWKWMILSIQHSCLVHLFWTNAACGCGSGNNLCAGAVSYALPFHLFVLWKIWPLSSHYSWVIAFSNLLFSSICGDSYHEGLKKWVEVGNSGMFRPEMLQPMGLPADVSVIAWGLSLERYKTLWGLLGF